MSISRQLNRRVLTVAVALLTGATPLVSGLLVMNYQLNKRLEQSATVAVDEALFTFDRLFDGLRAAAVLALPSTQKACTDIEPKLANQVAGNPRLQALTVLQGEQHACSSAASGPLPVFDPSKDIYMFYDPAAIPDGVLVAYRLVSGDRSVIATTYGLEIRSELRAFRNGLRLALHFGDQYIWAEGDSRDPARPSMPEYLTSATSTKYGYRVEVGYPQGFTAAEARQARTQVLPSLVLVSVLTSAVVMWSLRRRYISTERETADHRPTV
ncbi:CSS-motif domain-containing protein [Pseudomonas sp. S75]|uniref:CSS-motif domain-containing protein n=1 Tax=unclassified Pseudomonas TaxID=196821 RepID=UPI001904D410|nr:MULTISPECIES: CSS-motif domain-containing protein [unclassified Pseudomonas]MBJ9975848.1 CSS-motif domain-containing protein [Pseudomonas sp. S30]MBK0154588.1 CSS-motif domain-containing protein [Pseudomonas sp. S75]